MRNARHLGTLARITTGAATARASTRLRADDADRDRQAADRPEHRPGLADAGGRRGPARVPDRQARHDRPGPGPRSIPARSSRCRPRRSSGRTWPASAGTRKMTRWSTTTSCPDAQHCPGRLEQSMSPLVSSRTRLSSYIRLHPRPRARRRDRRRRARHPRPWRSVPPRTPDAYRPLAKPRIGPRMRELQAVVSAMPGISRRAAMSAAGLPQSGLGSGRSLAGYSSRADRRGHGQSLGQVQCPRAKYR